MSWGFYAAAASVATVPPEPELVSRSVGGSSAGSGFSPATQLITLPAPAEGTGEGELILVAIGANRNTVAPSPSLPGFTKLLDVRQVFGTTAAGLLYIYGKIATASESNPTFTHGVNGTAQMGYIAERWSGVSELPEVQTGVGYTTGGTFTLTDNARVTDDPNSIVWSAIGGRGPTGGDVSESWGGGAVGLYNTASGQIGFVNNASQVVASPGSVTPTCQITNSQSGPASCIGSVILSPGGGGPPPPPSAPAYVPAGHEDKYNVYSGAFNWNSTNTATLKASLEGADSALSKQITLGNSVGEGWTSLVGTTVTEDRLHAFPLMYRDKLAELLSVPVAGTGHVRCRSIQMISHYHDARWNSQVVQVASWSNGTHHVSSASSAVSPIVFTSDKAGTIVEIYAIDRAGALRVSIDGGTDQIISGGGTDLPIIHQFTGLANTTHTVSIKPNTNTQITILGASVHNSVGLLMHNPSQGGAQVRTSVTGQNVWSDESSGVANMLPCYSHADMHGDVDVVFVELAGNDLQNTDADTEIEMQPIIDGLEAVGEAFPGADIVLLLITEGGSGFDADYDLFYEMAMDMALANDWPVIDTQFILGGYDNIIAQGWGTDAYGHLNTTGATYLGHAIANIVVEELGL